MAGGGFGQIAGVAGGLGSIGAQGAGGAMEGLIEGEKLRRSFTSQDVINQLHVINTMLGREHLVKAQQPTYQYHGDRQMMIPRRGAPVVTELPMTAGGQAKLDLLTQQAVLAKERAELADVRQKGTVQAQIEAKIAAGTPLSPGEQQLWAFYSQSKAPKAALAEIEQKVMTGGVKALSPGEQDIWNAHHKPASPHFNSGMVTDDRGNTTQVITRTDPVTGKSTTEKISLGKIGRPASEGMTPVGSSDAIELAARQYLSTRSMPPMGWGKAGASARMAVLERAAQIAKESGVPFSDVAAKQAEFKAGQSELSQLQAQRGKIMAFATTADKNLDVASGLSEKVGRTGVPILNQWLLAGRRATGDPDVSAFDAAVRVGINETARVTSGQAGGASTDTARREIESMLNTAQTPEQFRAVVRTLKADMGNRRTGYDDQIKSIQEGLRGWGETKSPGGPPPVVQPALPAGAHREGDAIVSDSGKYVWDGAKWQPKK